MKPLAEAVRWVCAIAILVPSLASAEVTEFVVQTREILYGGDSFGEVGPYEKLRGYAVGEIDPTNPQNAVIANLDKAERNANGLVGYRVDVEIHKPVDLARGNGTLLYDVVNRGNKLALGSVRLEDGFVLVWSGWQGDLVPNGERLTATFPIATEGGSPLVGLSREEYIGDGTITGDLSYPAENLDPDQASLTVRENERDPRVPIDSWRYLSDTQIEIIHPGSPYDAGAIFEFIYPAMDPILHAVGFAATRDVNSFLRYEEADAHGNPNPLAEMVGAAFPPAHGHDMANGNGHSNDEGRGHGKHHDRPAIQRAMAMGISQSGRMLRHFIYLGFNQDEMGRQVFDGAFPIIPGSRKTWTNTLFAKPGWWSKQHEQHLQAGDQFPFAYATTTDPLTGERDGIMKRCRASQTCPKILHADGEFEVWGARGSLLVSDGDPAGPKPIDIPDNVRLYMVAGTPHGGAGTIVPANPSFGICKNLLNPNGSTAVWRALVVALNEWITTGRRPPGEPLRLGRQTAWPPGFAQLRALRSVEHRLPRHTRCDLHRVVQFPARYRLHRGAPVRRPPNTVSWCLAWMRTATRLPASVCPPFRYPSRPTRDGICVRRDSPRTRGVYRTVRTSPSPAPARIDWRQAIRAFLSRSATVTGETICGASASRRTGWSTNASSLRRTQRR